MNIRDLKKRVDFIVSRLKDHENPLAVIPLRETSLGATPYAEIRHVGRGNDFDLNVVFFSPEKGLVGVDTPQEKIIKIRNN